MPNGQEQVVVVQELESTSEDHDGGAEADEPRRRRVLVVDDDKGLLNLLRLILNHTYEVSTATNGQDALTISEEKQLDLIVLDLRMPVLDGSDFFRELRARGDTTPVLLTSSFGARTAQRELGAEGALEKPFEPDTLLAAVGSLIS
jgi:DNA-binding response OmpR family regulator